MEDITGVKKIKDKRVLIIEDEESLSEMLTMKLEAEGCIVETAFDGVIGCEKIVEWKPDLILLDIVMPEMDGYGVLEFMKSKEISIPVIIISNSGQKVEIEKTRQLGAVGHLIKAEFDPEEVLEKVVKCFDVGSGNSLCMPMQDELEAKVDENAESRNVKILLVEDDNLLREICTKKLLKEGFTVYEAIDGEQALHGVNSVKPDLVLLDIILPSMDGFQVLGGIRSSDNEKVTKVPVIMLSNLGEEDDVERAMKAGANDYLVKAHFTTAGIVEKIDEMLKK